MSQRTDWSKSNHFTTPPHCVIELHKPGTQKWPQGEEGRADWEFLNLKQLKRILEFDLFFPEITKLSFWQQVEIEMWDKYEVQYKSKQTVLIFPYTSECVAYENHNHWALHVIWLVAIWWIPFELSYSTGVAGVYIEFLIILLPLAFSEFIVN